MFKMFFQGDPHMTQPKLALVHGDNTYEISTFCEWIRAFRCRRTSPADLARGGRLTFHELDGQILLVMEANHCHTLRSLVNFLDVDPSKIYRHPMKNIMCQCVQRQLTSFVKRKPL
jgi:hypothetical protein